jgi:hypothetical protein
MGETITVYRAGIFTSEPCPPWMSLLHQTADAGGDWDVALDGVLGACIAHTRIGDDIWTDAEVSAYRTPLGGYFVDMMAGECCHAEVWIPDPADWLPFHSAHVEPFLRTRVAMRQNDRIDRLANALIAWARHGDGKHIDCLTGESRIDQREDWERRKRNRPTPTVTNTTDNRPN